LALVVFILPSWKCANLKALPPEETGQDNRSGARASARFNAYLQSHTEAA
jgi:hypothetical protein